MRLWTAARSAAADRYTIDALGVPTQVLIERAALAVAREVAPHAGADTVVRVLVGPGNNGADGLAVCRILRGWGVEAIAILATDHRNDACETQLRLALAHGVKTQRGLSSTEDRSGPWVDALLGTGASGPPRGETATLLERVRPMPGPRIAIDIPSGVDPDDGAVPAAVFDADLTVTFVRSKPGLHITPGSNHAGEVVIADPGITAAPGDRSPLGLVSSAWCGQELRVLPPAHHKGTRGHVTVLGGGEATPGAPVLAATAALRSTAGLCTVATPSAATRAELIATRPELMVQAWPAEALVGDALVVGPGLTGAIAATLLRELYAVDPRPAVWDASGLAAIPPGIVPLGPRILTPHPKEAAGLLERAEPGGGWTTAAVQLRRLDAAQRLARAYNAVVVLKGAGSIIAAPDGSAVVSQAGTSALATAGTGDVLSGFCGALLAAGLEVAVAGAVAVHVHGLAGRCAAVKQQGAVLALDVALALRAAISMCSDGTADACVPVVRRS